MHTTTYVPYTTMSVLVQLTGTIAGGPLRDSEKYLLYTHATTYVSAYYYICVLVQLTDTIAGGLLRDSLLLDIYTTYSYIYVSTINYYMCPDTTVCECSYYYMS
jgi:hypothetical protein